MNLRHASRTLALSVLFLSATASYGRGGETGTLDEKDAPVVTSTEDIYWPTSKKWSPYYLQWDQFRRLRARLGGRNPFAPIPGWETRRAYRWNDRLFSDDGMFELLPPVERQPGN